MDRPEEKCSVCGDTERYLIHSCLKHVKKLVCESCEDDLTDEAFEKGYE